MAEKGAHLSKNTIQRPSIFELIAQEGLSDTFYPALRHVAEYLAEKNYTNYAFLVERYDEIFLIFNAVLQNYYLKNYGATFAEKFYNLRRIVHDAPVDSTFKLPLKSRLLSLLFVVVYPYVENKLRVEIEKCDNKLHAGDKKDFLLKILTISRFAIEAMSLARYIGYMTGKCDSYSVFLYLAGVELVYNKHKADPICWKTAFNNIISGNWKAPIALLKGMLGRMLELSAFFVQFLSWWHSEQMNVKILASPIPDPPNKRNIPALNNVCPICKNKRKIPTVLPVSGYVFCYKCISHSLMKNKRCPITNLPATKNELIRIHN